MLVLLDTAKGQFPCFLKGFKVGDLIFCTGGCTHFNFLTMNHPRSRLSMLDVAMVKQFTDILVGKRSAIITNNLMRGAKSTNYLLTDEICNC